MIHETCSCGADFTVDYGRRAMAPQAEWDSADAWRSTHRCLKREPKKPTTPPTGNVAELNRRMEHVRAAFGRSVVAGEENTDG